MRQPEAQDTSPGMTHNEYPLPTEPLPKIVRDVDRVLFHLRYIRGLALSFFVIRRIGLSRSSLVPYLFWNKSAKNST